MNNTPPLDTSPTLESIQQQFEAWRISRRKREPIPGPLWEAAAGLCRRYPITHVCRRLRLSFAQLKKRVLASPSTAVQFMELEPSCFPGAWHMECERPDGCTLRFSGNGQPPAVEALLVRFLA